MFFCLGSRWDTLTLGPRGMSSKRGLPGGMEHGYHRRSQLAQSQARVFFHGKMANKSAKMRQDACKGMAGDCDLIFIASVRKNQQSKKCFKFCGGGGDSFLVRVPPEQELINYLID